MSHSEIKAFAESSYEAGFKAGRAGDIPGVLGFDHIAFMAGYQRGLRPVVKRRCTALKIVLALVKK